MRNHTIVVLGVVMLLLLGCGKKRRAEPEPPPPSTMTYKPGAGPAPAVMKVMPAVDRVAAANDLKGVWDLGMADDGTPPPASPEAFRQAPSRIYNAIKEGHYVVVWNADRRKGKAIFAYWKDVPKEGGPVVLVDGTVIPNMSPQDFANTPKAGK